jgi:hypothetical protein
MQAQVSILTFYGRRSRPTGPVGVQYRSTPSAGVPLVGVGDGAIRDRAGHLGRAGCSMIP